MPDRKYTYEVQVDAATVQSAARQVRDAFSREMAQVGGGSSAGEAAKQQTAIIRAQTQAQVAAVRAASAEAANAARASAGMLIEQAKRGTEAERASSQERIALARTEATERQQIALQRTAQVRALSEREVSEARAASQAAIAQARAQAAAQMESERQKTAAFKAEQTAQAAAQRAAAQQRIAEERAATAAAKQLAREQAAAAKAAAAAAEHEAAAPETLDKAINHFNEGEFDTAIDGLSAYLKNPKAKRAEEATFYRAEAYFATKQYKKAIVDYSRFPEKFTKSKRMPHALLQIGRSFEAMGMKEDAKGFYQELTDKFPKSPEAKKVRSKTR